MPALSRTRKLGAAACLGLAAVLALLAWLDHRDWQTTTRWVRTTGRVVRADWKEYDEEARLEYEYRVGERAFRTDSRRFTDVSRERWAFTLWRTLTSPLDPLIQRDYPEIRPKQFQAKVEAEQNPPGTELEVWYDPQAPERAILTYLADSEATTALSLMALGMACLGGCFLGLRGPSRPDSPKNPGS